MRSLTVTTPFMKGQDVIHAQNTLVKNVFNQNYLMDSVDGVFGPASGRACIRAKYWVGYKTVDQLPTYGTTLDNLLTGAEKLPEDFLKRRKARQKIQSETPIRMKALVRAIKDLGMKESPPDSNQCPITREWGLLGPWCAMAVSTWYADVGSKAFKIGRNYSYVPWMISQASQGANGLAITSTLLPGDLVAFDWNHDGTADHVGMCGDAETFQRLAPNAFREAIQQQGRPDSSQFWTIEGNTGYGRDSDGGEVMFRLRNYSSVARTGSGRRAYMHTGR